MTTDATTERRAKPNTQDEVMERYPALTAHLICHSLGYFSPQGAAHAILDHIRGRSPANEWYMSMASKERPLAQVNRDTIKKAIQMRHSHRGFMADYRTARALIQGALNGPPTNIPGGSW